LLPWIVYLAYSLPSRQVSADYDIAWAGFDVMLLVALASTGYFAFRRSRYSATAAAATATLLVVDAWFDVMTTPRRLPATLLVIVRPEDLCCMPPGAGRICGVMSLGAA
jgi:hypothetical protein